MAYTVNTSAAALNRAFNNADATTTAFAATAADLAAGTIAAANKFDDGTLSDLALSTKVLTNMGILPSTVTEVKALEAALADYFAGPGKGNRGYVVLQLAEILSGFAPTDVFYGAAATAWNAEIAASAAQSTDQTLSLTASTTDSLVGGLGADIFAGVNSLLTSAKTMDVTDKIAGGAGNDTFNVAMNTAWSGFTTGTVTDVETIALTNNNSAETTFDASGISGATTYTLNAATGGFTSITDIGTGFKTLNINGQKGATGSTTLSTTFVNGAAETAVAAVTDAVTVNVTDVGATAAVTLTLNSFETVNLNSTLSANTGNAVSFSTTGAVSKLNVAGSGKITIAAVDNELTAFDASAATGVVTATLTNVSGVAQLATVLGGSASDVITVDTQDLKSNATISGGAGTADELKISNSITAGTTTTVEEYVMTGFEKMTIGAVTAGSTTTFSAVKTTDLATIATGTTTDANIVFLGLGANAITFEASGANTTSRSVTSDNTGVTTINLKAAGTAAVAGTGTDTSVTTYSLSDSSAVTLNVKGYVSTASTETTVTAPKATSITVNTDAGFDAAGVEKTTFNSTVSAATAKTFTVTAAGALGSAAKISAPEATTGTVTYTNSTTAGELFLDTDKLQNLTVTTANTLDLDDGTALTKLQTLNIAANKGTTTFADALADIGTITLSGTGVTSGSQSAIVLGDLGSNDNGYDLTLSATGLKGSTASNTVTTNGLYVGNVVTTKGYNATFNLTGVTGSVRIGNISDATDTAKNVSVTAPSIGGTLEVGDVVASGDVVINAAGADDASLGAVTGGTVNVDISGTAYPSTVGNITAGTSATVKYYGLSNNTQTIAGSATSTALAVNVTGGSLVDTITLSAGAAQTSITATGDLGASTDSVIVNANTSVTKTISLAGLLNYDASTITGGTGKDTIIGGSGADVIRAGQGQDTLTGGDGKDSFVFNGGDSSVLAPDTITDFKSGDEIQIGFGGDITTLKGTQTVAAGTTLATIDSYGVATFANMTTAPANLSAAVTAIEGAVADTAGTWAFFSYSGDTYVFIESGTGASITTDIVVKLSGVVLPNAALTDANTSASFTGLSGFGA